jgi:hypothetical protein
MYLLAAYAYDVLGGLYLQVRYRHELTRDPGAAADYWVCCRRGGFRRRFLLDVQKNLGAKLT